MPCISPKTRPARASEWLAPAAPSRSSSISFPPATLKFTEGSATSTDSLSQTDGATSAEAATAVAPDVDVVLNHGTVFALQAPSALLPPPARPVVQALAPQRYRVQFTIGQDTHDAVKRLQALMRRELPDGDLAVIFDQGVRLLLEKVEKAKLGVGAKRRHGVVKPGAYETRIRFKTDSSATAGPESAGSRSGSPGEREATKVAHRRERPSRHIPNEVKRAVWRRDGGQCAFVSANGRRCTERAFLELHHIHPHALDGPATVANVSLRCRRHNAYEAELVFGLGAGVVREAAARYRT